MADAPPNSELHPVWTLVFADSTYRHWTMRWLKPGFKHVYAMRKTKHGNQWLIVHPHHSHTQIDLEPTQLYPTASDYVNALPLQDRLQPTIITVSAKINQYDHNRHISTLSCVDIIKSILGIRDAFCFTPYRLYKNITGGKYGRYIQNWSISSQKTSETAKESASRAAQRRAAASCGS